MFKSQEDLDKYIRRAQLMGLHHRYAVASADVADCCIPGANNIQPSRCNSTKDAIAMLQDLLQYVEDVAGYPGELFQSKHDFIVVFHYHRNIYYLYQGLLALKEFLLDDNRGVLISFRDGILTPARDVITGSVRLSKKHVCYFELHRD